MGSTTIAISDEVRARLGAYKEQAGLSSMDDALRAVLTAHQHTATALHARRRAQVQAVIEAYAIQRLVAFGSRVWGVPTPRSDLDLAVACDLPDVGTLLDLQDALAAAYGVPVDVSLLSGLKPRLRDRVQAEGVVLHG